MKIPSALAVATVIGVVTAGGVPTATPDTFPHVGPARSGAFMNYPFVNVSGSPDINTRITRLQINFQRFASNKAMFGEVNVIDVATLADLPVTVNVNLADANLINAEIDAICTGFSRNNPRMIGAVFIGSDDLQYNGCGSYSVDDLIAYIERVKCCTGNKVPVGTALRSSTWLNADGIHKLAESCDVIGVNIMPFEYSNVNQDAFSLLKEEWAKVNAKFDPKKLVLAKTGYPYAGPEHSCFGKPSIEKMEKYLDDYLQWTMNIGLDLAFWHEMFDTNVAHVKNPYLYGLYSASGAQNVLIRGIPDK